MAESGGEPDLSRRDGRRTVEEIWLRQRPRSWYWAAAFVVALVVVLVALRLVEPVGPTAF